MAFKKNLKFNFNILEKYKNKREPFIKLYDSNHAMSDITKRNTLHTIISSNKFYILKII